MLPYSFYEGKFAHFAEFLRKLLGKFDLPEICNM